MKKALVVKDNPDLLKILIFEMEMMGFSVIGAKDGKEGVEKAIKSRRNPTIGVHSQTGPPRQAHGIGSEFILEMATKVSWHEGLPDGYRNT